GILRGKLEGNRKEKALSRDALLLHAAAHFLEEDPLVGGVLIDEDEAVGVLHQDVEFAEDAEELEGVGLRGRLRVEGGELRAAGGGECGGRWWFGSGWLGLDGEGAPVFAQGDLLARRN